MISIINILEMDTHTHTHKYNKGLKSDKPYPQNNLGLKRRRALSIPHNVKVTVHILFRFVTTYYHTCLFEKNQTLNKEDKQRCWCILKISVLWDVMSCQLVESYLSFEGTVILCSVGNYLTVNTA